MDRDDLLERAQFGQQIELFFGSQVGQYLRNRALEQYNAAIEQWKSCDPTDTRLVMKLQNEARVAEWFEQWLTEAIIDGAKALELLQEDFDANS